MLDIGTTLQDARTRKGLALPDAAEATRIRVKFLAALEGERFGELPADVYARGFLRTYAEYLGLDGDVLVSELNARIEASAPPPPPPPPEPRLRLPTLDGRAWAFLGAASLLVLVALLGWHRGDGPRSALPTTPPATKHVAALGNSTADRPPATPTPARAGPPIGHLTLVAARGDCWLSVHVSSRDGRVAYEGLLRMGESVPLAGKRFWIRIGAPWNLEAKLNGRLLTGLPPDTANVLVTTAGLRTA
ncbi:MAG TPA: RodZ domain-containing protein [Gaiellaceae bacterium]|nr:RodZ domain-containing protein [Gaiellaceae bacterium]